MGVIRQHAHDPLAAIDYYAEVLKQPSISSDIAFQAHLSLVSTKCRAKIFLSQSDLKEMIDELENAVKNLSTKSSAAHLQLLRLYSQVDSVRAIENGNKAIDLADTPQKRIVAYLGFADFCEDIQNWKCLEQNAKKAIDLLNLQKQTIESKHNLVRAYQLLRDKENADKQIREVIAMIELEPQADAYDYLMKGVLESFIERYDLMEKSFIKALEMKPNLIQANIGLGALYSKFGDDEKTAKHANGALNFYQRALSFANRAIEDDPTMIEAYMFRAQTYRSMDRVDESAADYQRVLTLDPTFRTGNLGLSSLFADRKDYDRALKYINLAIEAKKDPLFFNERGTYYLMTDRKDLALADYLMSQELMAKDIFNVLKNPEGNRVNLYNIRDQVALLNRQLNVLTSRKDFQAGIILCDKFTELHDLKGKMAFVHKIKSSLIFEDSKLKPSDQQSIQMREALSEIDQAISLEPNDVHNHTKRLLILIDLKEFSEALTEANKVISFDPTNPAYYTQRSLVHLKTNNLDGVLQDVQKALSFEKDEKQKEELNKLIEGINGLKKEEEGKKKINNNP
jgi:tetratricopeptide (TPR) repeat protein